MCSILLFIDSFVTAPSDSIVDETPSTNLLSVNISLLSLSALQNQILWIDNKNLTVCVESGIIGQDLDRRVSPLPSSVLSSIHRE